MRPVHLLLLVLLLTTSCADPLKREISAQHTDMASRADTAAKAGKRGDPGQLPPEMLAALVRVESTAYKAGYCTGALVAPDIVVTAAHCIGRRGAADFTFRAVDGIALRGLAIIGKGELMDKELDSGGMVYFRSAVDWALIRTEDFGRPGLQVKPMTANEVTQASRAGATVLTAGHYRGTLQAIGPCRLKDLWEFGFFETDCPVAQGDSGGPVVLLTEDGPRLIGIHSGARDGLAFATSALQFHQLLAQH